MVSKSPWTSRPRRQLVQAHVGLSLQTIRGARHTFKLSVGVRTLLACLELEFRPIVVWVVRRPSLVALPQCT